MVILNHMLKGFKDFILRGNVLDLAVAFIMGAAFNEVVKALVNSILMPAISMVVGVQNYDNFLAFGDVKVGVFLTAVVNFLLVAAALYFAVVMPMKKLNARVSKKKAEDMEDTELSLLKEIRDSLTTKK
jgi:large conductance mechanosensitive channel protein